MEHSNSFPLLVTPQEEAANRENDIRLDTRTETTGRNLAEARDLSSLRTA